MKKSHLLTLLVVAIVVGLAGVFFEISQSSKWDDSKAAQTVLPDLAVNDITKIEIRSTPAGVTLEKKDDKWTVADRDNYLADFS
jgi:Flp pilus assembly protein CpaB